MDDITEKLHTNPIAIFGLPEQPETYIETKKTKDQLMRRMHAMVNGELIAGAKVFLIIWNEIDRFKTLAKILKQPILFQVFFIIYEAIALPLYLKNKIFN